MERVKLDFIQLNKALKTLEEALNLQKELTVINNQNYIGGHINLKKSMPTSFAQLSHEFVAH